MATLSEEVNEASLDGVGRPGPAGAWLLAARPRTLPLAAAPVLVGTAVAWNADAARAGPALAALAGALLLQVGANFANDVFDARRGADGPDRLGPARAVASGWLSEAAVLRATALSFGLALLLGLYLVWVGGLPILLLGLLSIAAGLAYTGGPYPLGYHGWGEVAVFAFFGLGAVCGTVWVQAGTLPAAALLASVPVGALAAAVLVVNNVRDAETDRRAGKRTVAVRFGEAGARRLYRGLLTVSFALPALWAALSARPGVALPLAAAPLALRLDRALQHERGPALNERLAGTARLALLFSALLALGLAVRC